MTRTPTSDPVAAVTEAGRRAEYELCHFNTCAGMRGPNDCDCGVARAILAIEAEARQQARAAFAAQVAELELSRDQQERFKWRANERADGLAQLARRMLYVRHGAVPYPRELADGQGIVNEPTVGEWLALAASPEPASPEAPGSGLDVETDCDHPKVGPMAPDFPGEWACYRCGQRFMPQNAARPDGAEADAS